jgi:hypothetical protein
MTDIEKRLMICDTCDRHVDGLMYGGCRELRDSGERVRIEFLTMRLHNGVCPLGKFQETNRRIDEEKRTKQRRGGLER